MTKTKRKAAALHNMHSYFGKKGRSDDPVAGPDLNEQEQEPEHVEEEISVPPITPTATPPPPPPPVQRSHDDSPVLVVQRDPGLRCQIWDYLPNDQEKARLAYMKHGPYQFHKDDYPLDDAANHPRKFQYHWFKTFPWLEYSPIKDAVYCFPCFLFYKKPLGKKGSDKFTVEGFRKWKKVNSGKDCAFLTHMGKDSKSAHNYAVKCYDNLKNKSCHVADFDFEEQEKENLRCQLRHYEHDIPTHPKFQNLTTISELCQQLAATGKNDDYHLIDRLIRLVLTLPVSTATTERAFSAMKLVKTRLRNKMEDGFLTDCLVIYIEKEIAVGITTDAIIDEFDEAPRRVDFN